jgi:hypothetical protein
MEMTMTSGARYFPRYGLFAVSEVSRCRHVQIVPSNARWPFAGHHFHPALIDMTGIDLPTTDRMRMSASEP